MAEKLAEQFPAGAKFSFTGRRMYEVLLAKVLDPTWVRYGLKAVPAHGMYGTDERSEEIYRTWVSEHGADPMYDEVLADSYVAVCSEEWPHFLCARNPEVLADLHFTVELSLDFPPE